MAATELAGLLQAGTYGTSSGLDIALGSGGGGAGGGGGGYGGGTSGGYGGSGGGAVKLVASNALAVAGTVSVDGGTGGDGGNAGGNGTDNSYGCSVNTSWTGCTATFGIHCSYVIAQVLGGGGAGAGGGSGGGIYLQANGNLTVSGTLSAQGGVGGNGGSPQALGCNDWPGGGAGGGGGRIKIFYNPCANNNIAGTNLVAGGSGGNSSSGAASSGGSGTYTINQITGFASLTPGTIPSTSQTVCNGGTFTQVNGTAATGGTTTYNYQWYYTTTSCGAPTTGTGASANSGWAGVPGATGQNLTAADIGFAATAPGTYCFQRSVQSGTCYAWTTNETTVIVVSGLTVSSQPVGSAVLTKVLLYLPPLPVVRELTVTSGNHRLPAVRAPGLMSELIHLLSIQGHSHQLLTISVLLLLLLAVAV